MSIKFSNTSAQTTRIDVPYGPLTVLPNGDWTLCIGTVWDSTGTGSENYCFFSSGQTTGTSLTVFASPTARKLAVFMGAGTTGRAVQDFVMEPGGAYILVVERRDGQLRTKVCPVISSVGAPNDGSMVRTSPTPYAITGALDGPYGMRIGERAADRRNDNSLFRAFCIHGVLTDLEIARLAWGMDLYEINKTPVWYVRMNNGADTDDFGPNKLEITRSTGADPLPTGTAPAFGYVSVNSPPAITAPTIKGSPQVGTTVTCEPGQLSGYPLPVVTYQWLRNGVAISGATGETYIPVVEDIGTNTLSRRDTATSAQGTATATSAPASVTAAANTISAKEIEAERIFQRIGNAASVPIEVTYTGVQPASIEYQLLDPDGVTVRKAWVGVGSPVTAGGATTAAPSMPQGAKKYRLQVRSKNASGTVIATSAVGTNQFGVGDLIALVGSSSAATWIQKYTGSATNNDAYSLYLSGEWSIRPEATHTSKMASILTTQRGVVVGMLSFGVGGTSLNGTTGWINKTHTLWTNFASGVQSNGGKLAGIFISMGSNDAAGGTITSKAMWLGIMRQFVVNCRELTGQPDLKVLWSGYNRRTGTTKPQDVFDIQSNYVRMAENQIGDDAGVYHTQALDYPLTDGVHLTGAGFDACTTRMAYVWCDALAGTYRRGPKITSFAYQGTKVRVQAVHRNGTGLVPSSGAIGFTVSDAGGVVPIDSVLVTGPSTIDITCSRSLNDPVSAQYLSGSAPPLENPVYDNGALVLPMHAETELATTQADLSNPGPSEPEVPTQPGSTIDATKVPSERRVVFEGSKRVVSFLGSIHKVRF